ncbi:hypothetical protein PoB_005128900 [Plakobranchus ocellatus]|uniref:Uncharacterized protein n=1 Tax=Plakobranchus ocellatus TaxID=259542 RepID=A0AAV4BX47_9GAST|nr:hypothetical protein PoB_005128900 [Plakobranchus ocellatus]
MSTKGSSAERMHLIADWALLSCRRMKADGGRGECRANCLGEEVATYRAHIVFTRCHRYSKRDCGVQRRRKTKKKIGEQQRSEFRGVECTLACETAPRSAGTLLSRVRAPLRRPGLEDSLRA